MSNDAFVTKLSPSGSGLVYSTFIGGVGDDQANGITIDGSGNAYLAGLTSSSDYPTVSAAQNTFGGGSGQNCGDAFITKLNSSASAISFSTFLGGSGCDVARAIALDPSGNVYVTVNHLLAKYSSAGALIWSRQLPGTVRGTAVAPSGDVYAVGSFSGTVDFDPSPDVFSEPLPDVIWVSVR